MKAVQNLYAYNIRPLVQELDIDEEYYNAARSKLFEEIINTALNRVRRGIVALTKLDTRFQIAMELADDCFAPLFKTTLQEVEKFMAEGHWGAVIQGLQVAKELAAGLLPPPGESCYARSLKHPPAPVLYPAKMTTALLQL
jgi:hypothetical protein